ncbi:serine hydrolase domain-containing protein [Nocardia sp. NPDC050793]|uniref:serine hydrolase domain-containing protein n=1 Tax=Nocardia sp. NPDC050793 TaxID=3155159 RepID=UPI0033E9E127
MDSDFQKALVGRVVHAQATARIPGLTVAVAVDGKLFAHAWAGWADWENSVRVTGESSYRIGSITKTFTAALTLLLAEQGDLHLDNTVGRYLPDTPFGHLPLRMLLSHHSGLQREAPTRMWETMQGPSAAELRDAFRQVELVAEPGQRWHYSNLGYAVLGQIIETVTNRPCEAAIEQTLLTPLGLTDTMWTQPASAVVGYRLDPNIDGVHREPVMNQAAIGVGGQLWSTADDLLRWGYALAGGESAVLPAAVVEKMHTLQVMVDTTGWTRGWGLGLILERCGDRVVAGHTGAMPGFQSALIMDRCAGVTVVVLANVTRGVRPADLAKEVLLEVVALQPAAPKMEWRPVPCPENIQQILGSWWSEADETVFRWEHDGLHARLASEPDTTDTHFIEEGPGRFRAAEGRLQGELLEVAESLRGIEMRWATYPLTRTPR